MKYDSMVCRESWTYRTCKENAVTETRMKLKAVVSLTCADDVCACDGLPIVVAGADVGSEVGIGLNVSGMVAVKLTTTVDPA